MNKQTEALKLALEALESNWDGCVNSPKGEAITAIREALAEQPVQGCEFCSHPLYAGTKCKNCGREQPHKQQEPVAVYVGDTWCGSVVRLYEDLPLETPLYTSPQPRKPLTDEQIEQCMKQAYSTVRGRNLELEFARAIEAAHGIGEQK